MRKKTLFILSLLVSTLLMSNSFAASQEAVDAMFQPANAKAVSASKTPSLDQHAVAAKSVTAQAILDDQALMPAKKTSATIAENTTVKKPAVKSKTTKKSTAKFNEKVTPATPPMQTAKPHHPKNTPPEVIRSHAKSHNRRAVISPKQARYLHLRINRQAKPTRNIHRTWKSHITMYPGSLKNNITRIAQRFGWKHIVWTLPNDYRWVGTARVSASSLQTALRKVLENYPLQADFYQGNHVLVIIPRTLR